MQAQRYQRGSLSLLKRKSQPDAWVFRYYAEKGGRRVYKKKIVGTLVEFPKRMDAEKAVVQLRVDANHGASFAPINLGQLVAHFKRVELPHKAYSTVEGYKNYLDLHILPKWGHYTLSAIKSVDVESWLRSLKRVDGQAASPGTKTKIRNLFSTVFSHAIRYEWASTNPITAVRTSAKRVRTPDILSPKSSRHYAWSFSARACHGHAGRQHRSAPRRVDRSSLARHRLRLKQANVTHSVWHNVEGDTKTEASRKPVPLHPLVIVELNQWKLATLYHSDDDFLFPSIAKNGSQPMQPDMILKRHIRPALERIGIKKRIGWHSFRHGLATMLRQKGVDIKTAQELLRHANSRITQDIYMQAVSEEKRVAQDLVFRGLLKGSSTQHPSAPSETVHERRCHFHKPMILFGLWRGRRGSNPRPLP